jgi:hypothetical protein
MWKIWCVSVVCFRGAGVRGRASQSKGLSCSVVVAVVVVEKGFGKWRTSRARPRCRFRDRMNR